MRAPTGVGGRRTGIRATTAARAWRRICHGPTYAALDLGTNNCRLLVARATHDGFRVVDAFSRIIRLGEGITASGRLERARDRARDRGAEICRDKMRNRGVTRARLIATEACRSAVNGGGFPARRCASRSASSSRSSTARPRRVLAATGCTPLIDPDARGRRSCSISAAAPRNSCGSAARCRRDRGPPQPDMRGWVSLPVGVVTLAERHGGIVVTPRDFRGDGRGSRRAIVAASPPQHGGDLDGMHLLGTSGTVTTIAGVHLELKRYDRRRVDGCWMSDAEVTERGRAAARHELRASASPMPASAPSAPTSCSPAAPSWRRSAARFPCARLRVADRGLREGMLVQMMRAGRHVGRGAERTMTARDGSGRALKVRVQDAARPHAVVQSSGSNASSTILMSRAPSAKAIARAPPTSSIEIDDKYRFLKPRRARRRSRRGARRLEPDRGEARRRGEGSGRVVAIDCSRWSRSPGVEFLQLDFLDPAAPAALQGALGGPADVVLSDMAANATGHRKTDHLKIMALVEAAADFAGEVLKPGGAFLAKVLQGGTEASCSPCSSAISPA